MIVSPTPTTSGTTSIVPPDNVPLIKQPSHSSPQHCPFPQHRSGSQQSVPPQHSCSDRQQLVPQQSVPGAQHPAASVEHQLPLDIGQEPVAQQANPGPQQPLGSAGQQVQSVKGQHSPLQQGPAQDSLRSPQQPVVQQVSAGQHVNPIALDARTHRPGCASHMSHVAFGVAGALQWVINFRHDLRARVSESRPGARPDRPRPSVPPDS